MIEEAGKATLHETPTEELRTYPCIIIKRVYVSVCNGFIDSGEDGLGTDHPPSCSSLRRGLELAKEPVLLATLMISVSALLFARGEIWAARHV